MTGRHRIRKDGDSVVLMGLLGVSLAVVILWWPLEHYDTGNRMRRMLDRDDADPSVLSKPCGAIGCSGTMYWREPMEQPPSPTHLEFPTCAMWVCTNNAAHTEVCEMPAHLVVDSAALPEPD